MAFASGALTEGAVEPPPMSPSAEARAASGKLAQPTIKIIDAIDALLHKTIDETALNVKQAREVAFNMGVAYALRTETAFAVRRAEGPEFWKAFELDTAWFRGQVEDWRLKLKE